MPKIHSKACSQRGYRPDKSKPAMPYCPACNGDGIIETDNNGAIVDCGVCEGTGIYDSQNYHIAPHSAG